MSNRLTRRKSSISEQRLVVTTVGPLICISSTVLGCVTDSAPADDASLAAESLEATPLRSLPDAPTVVRDVAIVRGGDVQAPVIPAFRTTNDGRVAMNLKKPNEFYAEYVKRFGEGEWSAVSWEYASIMDLWADAASKAGSTAPEAVLEAMKAGGKGKQAFGEAVWWGKELFGIDNALVGVWPVVVIEDGKAKIKQFKSIPDWWNKHSALMIKHMEALKKMYYQRT